MRSIRTRLTRLEAQRDAEHQAQSHVIRLGLDGLPEEQTYVDGGGPWIFLPRKAASVEEWVEQVARCWQGLRAGGEVSDEPAVG